MKNIFFILSIVFSLLVVGCKDNSTSSNNLKKELKTVIKTDKNVFRGVQFGNKREDVKRFEENEKVIVENSNRITYEIDLGNEEFADVSYGFNDDLVNSISVDIYKNDVASARLQFKDYTDFYTNKYGEPVVKNAEERQWKSEKVNSILILYASEEDPGLEIQFTPAN